MNNLELDNCRIHGNVWHLNVGRLPDGTQGKYCCECLDEYDRAADKYLEHCRHKEVRHV